MDHVAIDLGGRESQICRRQEDGTILEEKRIRTPALPDYWKGLAPSVVILETGPEAFKLADAARAAGHTVRVVAATLAPSLGVGARGIKTDRRDARALSEASCRMALPSVHVPSQVSRERKSLLSMRESLVRSRTQLINTVRGWLRRDAVMLSRGTSDRFPERVQKEAKRRGTLLPSYVVRQLVTIDDLTLQIQEADGELEQIAKQEPVCLRLMTVPGVGPVNAVMYVTILDDIARFGGAAAVASYLGLTPGEASSSSRTQRTGITRAGSSRMRWLLVQAAWCAIRTRPNDPMVQWAMEVSRRRGKQIAAIALARKLAGILYALWRDGGRYDPHRGASPKPATAENEEKKEATLELLRSKKRA